MAAETKDPLIVATRHVEEGRRIVLRQRARITRLKAAGCSTLGAEQTLAIFENTLAIFVEHERMIRAERGLS